MHLVDPGRLVEGNFLKRTVVRWRLVSRDFLERFFALLKFAPLAATVADVPGLVLVQSAVLPFYESSKISKKKFSKNFK